MQLCCKMTFANKISVVRPAQVCELRIETICPIYKAELRRDYLFDNFLLIFLVSSYSSNGVFGVHKLIFIYIK